MGGGNFRSHKATEWAVGSVGVRTRNGVAGGSGWDKESLDRTGRVGVIPFDSVRGRTVGAGRLVVGCTCLSSWSTLEGKTAGAELSGSENRTRERWVIPLISVGGRTSEAELSVRGRTCVGLSVGRRTCDESDGVGCLREDEGAAFALCNPRRQVGRGTNASLKRRSAWANSEVDRSRAKT